MTTNIKPFNFYLLRLPLLPLNKLDDLHAYRNRKDFVTALRTQYQFEHIQEAIYLASPELYQELLKWLVKPASEDEQADHQLVLTLYKYLLRMSSRCTPYGLFAGFNLGAIAEGNTRLTLENEPQRHTKHCRLDMNYVAELSKQAATDLQVKNKLQFCVNTSLYRTSDTYRYYKYRIKNKRRYYYLISLKSSVYLQQVIDAAWQGTTYEYLVNLLIATGIASEEATHFVDQLVASQILVSELEPTVTGPEFYDCFVERVQTIAPDYPRIEPLRQISTLLGSSSIGMTSYQAVQDIVREALPATTSKNLIQTDLRLEMSDNTLSTAAMSILSQDLNELAVLSTMTMPVVLQRFIVDFHQRYGEQEIPLLEALDTESGIGYGIAHGAKVNYTPLIDDLRMPAQAKEVDVPWTAYRQLLFSKFLQSQQQGQQAVSVTQSELAALVNDKPLTLPPTLYAIGSFISVSPAALDRGEFKFYLATCTGPGAMTLLARFAHADPALAAKLVACGEQEQARYGEALLAEVIHLPEARVGNVLQRPQLRAYEIPFLGNASVATDKQIPVSDLYLSVKQGRILLRSKRLNKEVIPRMTSAHNYSKGLAIYKFLCDLQHQHEPFSISWDWGPIHKQAFLPRVEYKHVILSRARWYLASEIQEEVTAIHTSEQLAAFRHRYCLPHRVLLADGDNELLLDFSFPLALKLLLQRLRKGAAVLFECLHEATSTLVTDQQQGKYVNEVIIPFTSIAPVIRAKADFTQPAAFPMQRSFSLGSEWTYLKVYCGAKWAECILTEHLLPCIARLETQQQIKKWFFIRYADPDTHLRLRFQHDGHPATIAAIIEQMHQALTQLQEERIVRVVQYDTYQPEIDRN